MKVILCVLIFITLVIFISSQTNKKIPKFTTSKIPSTTFNLFINCSLEFDTFKRKNIKKYSNKTIEAKHKIIFCNNLKKIHNHNANKSASFKMAINSFSDLDLTELKFVQGNVKLKDVFVKQIPQLKVQKKVRGRNVNLGFKTGPVKDQGSCLGSWLVLELNFWLHASRFLLEYASCCVNLTLATNLELILNCS